MLDQIQELIRGYAREASANVKEVPSDKEEGVSNAAVDSIMGLFKDKISKNDISGLTQMFKDKNAVNNAASQAQGDFMKRLEGMGINMDTAKKIGAALLPLVLSKFSNSSGAKGGLGDLLSQFGGDDLTAALGGLLGGKKGKGGKDNGGGMFGKMKDLF